MSEARAVPVRAGKPVKRAAATAGLTAARRGHAAVQNRGAAHRRADLAVMLDEGGFRRPDDGCDAMIPCADDADMCLIAITKVPVAEAQRTVHARWPSVPECEFDGELC